MRRKNAKTEKSSCEGFAFCNVFPVIMMTMQKSAEWHIICSSHAVLYVVTSSSTTLACVGP